MGVIDLRQGDCLEEMDKLIAEGVKVDAIVTDPPYGLSFMGKKWDYDVPSVEIWKECLRVLKPGGYLLSFAGTRTQHRMCVNIEDAGFEIRDMIAWVYGVGFPKSHNINKALLKKVNCGNMEEYEKNQQKTKSQVSKMWEGIISTTLAQEKDNNRGTLQTMLEDLEQGKQYEIFTPSELREEIQIPERQRQSCLERWRNIPTQKGELHNKCKICEMPTGLFINGKKRWLCYGTQIDNGTIYWAIIDEDGVCSSYQSQTTGQSFGKLNVICEQCRTQVIRSEGWGTALKPAMEMITVARKPFKGTVANNVLKWGTGGINIDGCRVEALDMDELEKARCNFEKNQTHKHSNTGQNFLASKELKATHGVGRFPANLIHDGSDEVLDLFPETKTGKVAIHSTKGMWGSGADTSYQDIDNGGSAARFFYCAKASKSERNKGCEGLEEKQYSHDGRNKEIENAYQRNKSVSTNNHPTVKPVKLMQYLVRLVTPKDGTVLDPFMGSGSTGIACKKEGFDFIGIELDKDYFKIAKARIEKFEFQHELF